MRSPDWQAIRAQFPALAHWTYLDSATYGQLPNSAAAAVAAHFTRRNDLACSDYLDWFDDANEIRGLIAQLICCAPDDVAFIPNAAAGLSLLLSQLDWRAGDQVVTLADEFPNQLYYPALLDDCGVSVRAVAWDELETALTSRTRAVLLSTVNYQTGFRPPLESLAAHLRDRGILLYLDGTQSVGALAFDVQRVQPDMLAVHGYKWLLAPTGAGFLYVSPALRERLRPNVIGWRSHANWRQVSSLHQGVPVFSEAAEKYEGGMIPFALLYGLAASLRLMLTIGTAVIEQRVLELAGQVRQVLRDAGAMLLSDQAPHYDSPIIAARFPSQDARALAQALKERQILVSARRGNLRVSPHFYNNEADLAALAEGLAAVRLHMRDPFAHIAAAEDSREQVGE